MSDTINIVCVYHTSPAQSRPKASLLKSVMYIIIIMTIGHDCDTQ